MHPFYDYEFKTEATKKKWKDFLDNIDEEMKLSYKRRSSLSILINFKRSFNITPYTLRHSQKNEHADHRKFALYLLVHYSKDTLDDIANDFNTSIDEIQSVKSNEDLHAEYVEKIKMFFEPLKAGFKEGRRTSLAFSETIQEIIPKLILE